MASPKNKKLYLLNNKCLICGSKKLSKYLSLEIQAPANSYLTKAQLNKKEFKAPLEVYFCHNCNLTQLLHIVDRSHIYSDYAYFSSTSPMLVKHFEEYAKEVFTRFPSQSKQLVVDIGSNDGVLLKPFKRLGARVLGIDPAKNIAKIANEQGIETIADFFGKDKVENLIKKYGKAGIITSNNTLAHTDALHNIFEGVKEFLDEKGVFVFEVQYLLDLLTHNEFDNIYHEHICFHAITPLTYLLKMYRMKIIDIIHTDTHGGGIMVFATHSRSSLTIAKAVNKFLENEKRFGLDKLSTYKKFAKRPPIVKKQLTNMLLDLKKKGKKIVAYGASAKATTLLQYCDIGPDVIDYITDSASSKQGKFTPGTHIPIVAPDVLKIKTPDFIIITAWNYADNIMENEKWFKEKGGKFIIPIPEPKIV
ncbi:MAG: class I SAM-dependent methyltransferase [Candidatus Levyibacteriota bacterium]|nr:MAG: class I SAM-dependent methyltransferase [Candidatus Levybacteria bacterium]